MSEIDRHISNMKEMIKNPPDWQTIDEKDIKKLAEAILFILKQRE